VTDYAHNSANIGKILSTQTPFAAIHCYHPLPPFVTV